MKKEIFNKISRGAIAVSLPLLIAGWQITQNEAAIYRAFDKPDGSNALCKIDPWCRDLTDNEITIAKTSFGDDIDYGIVNVFARLPLSALLFGEEKKGDMYAYSGNLYLANPIWREGEMTLLDSELSQHEMTHVLQFQTNGEVFLLAGMEKEERQERETGISRYKYDITAPIDFKDYGLEQQAEIIENIQALRLDAHFKVSERKTICAELKIHEDKAKQMLPIRPALACINLKPTM